jgi:hypothetical protein
MEINDIINKMKEWWIIKNDKPLKVMIATALTRTIKGINLSLIIVGNSSSAKTDFINLLDDDGINTIKQIKIKPSSLGSGRVTKGNTALIEKLKERKDGLIILIPEMASILNANQTTQDDILATFRSLLDGELVINSDTVNKHYKGLNVTMIGATTPDIFNMISHKEKMGSRELYLRLERISNAELFEMTCINSSKDKEKIVNEIKEDIENLLNNTPYNNNLELSSNVKEKLLKWSELTILLRCYANKNSNTGELLEKMYPEQISRLAHQFIILYRSLRSLELDEEEALECIKDLALSNCEERRLDILLNLLARHGQVEGREVLLGFSSRTVGNFLKVSKNTALGELNTLYHLGLVEKIEQGEEPYVRSFFKANMKNEYIEFLRNELEEKLNKIKIDAKIMPSEEIEVVKIQ